MGIFIKEELSQEQIKFDDIVKKAAQIDADRADYRVSDVAANLWMADDGTISFCHGEDKKIENMEASGWALSQLSMKLNMPQGYAEKCILCGHADLAASNVNTWLTEQNGGKRKKSTDYLIRTYSGKIDGILSSGYTAFDTHKIMDVIGKSIPIDDYHIVGHYLTDERMSLRLIRDELLDIDGEDLYPGIFIDSSDVGRTALHVSFGIWKKVCTNGLCISKVGGVLYHQRHVGISPIEVETELVARVKMIPELITRSEAIIKSAAAEKIDLKDPKALENMINDIRRLSKITEDKAKEVIELATNKYGMTRWGIVNGMTEVAQSFNLDERVRIENAAGRLIAA